MLIHTRIEERADPEAALRRYRSLNPWFRWIPEEEAREAFVVGDPAHCRARLDVLARELDLSQPVLDLTGADAAACRRVIEALGPSNYSVDART